MKPSQSMRIVLLLVVIFSAGVLTGRFTASRPPVYIRTSAGALDSSEAVLDRLATEVKLDPSQREHMRPVIEELIQKMSALPPASEERLAMLVSFAPRMREGLRPEQETMMDQYLDDVRKRFSRAIRRQRESDPR